MSHKSIRLLIEKTVGSISDDIQYSYALETDFNQTRKKSSTLVNTAPLVATPTYQVNGVQNYMKQWNVQMAFYRPDKSGSHDYPSILDDLDDLVDKFINELNFYSAKSSEITLLSMNQTSFVQGGADITTGWLLTFQILASDTFDYCRECS